MQEGGLYKSERVIASAQSAQITLADGRQVLNFCANNYLGLANDPYLVNAAKESLDQAGFGMASVRFICGTQSVHTALESALAEFLGQEQALLYSSCFDANTGLFETLLDENDAIISDELNHASIIDGVRLCKARRYRYSNNDMASLEEQLRSATEQGARFKLIATDGVFSMDGYIANLQGICDLAERYGALVMVDDSHATGFIGVDGKGSPQACGVMERVDILTGTLGKALGGASGGYVAARQEIIDLLRQRSRPYLFSNALPPLIAAAALQSLELLQSAHGAALRAQLKANGEQFRTGLEAQGLRLLPGAHPIVPVMLDDAKIAATMARRLLDFGIYVSSFSYPVVPMGKARIRTQMSAAHTAAQIDQCIDAFGKVGREMGVCS